MRGELGVCKELHSCRTLPCKDKSVGVAGWAWPDCLTYFVAADVIVVELRRTFHDRKYLHTLDSLICSTFKVNGAMSRLVGASW